MGRKQESGFGVVARTGVSLLALGFGSALFGALVVGPSLGKQLGREGSPEVRVPASETRLASAGVDTGESTRVSHTREREPEPEPAVEEKREPEAPTKELPKTEDLSQFVEGTGADTVVPNDPAQIAADSQEPDRSHDEQSTTEPATVKTISEPEPARRTERSVEEPRARERKRETETPEVNERPRRQEARTESETRRREDDEHSPDRRESRRDRTGERTRDRATPDTESRRERTVATEPDRRRERDTPRTGERDDRDDRKGTRSRPAESSRTRVAEAKSDEVSPKRSETVKISAAKRPEPVKTASASASETSTEDAAADAKLFRVRVGRVQPREEAERLRDEIKETAGVDAFLVPIGDGYQVQTGAYRRKANAEKIAAELRSGNFKPRVTEDR